MLRVSIFIVCLIGFTLGLAYSVRVHDLDISQVRIVPLLFVLFLTPVSAVLNGVELRLCAMAVHREMKLENAVFVSSVASLTNLLPIPGGALVRASALIKVGASISRTSEVLLAAALMWVLMSLGISCLYLLSGNWSYLVAAGSGFLIVIIGAWISQRSHIHIGIGFALTRCVMLLLFTLRVYLTFYAIGSYVALPEVVVLSLAGVLGSAVSIVPAGLGLTEVFGALIAKYSGSDPSAAFIALGLSNIIAHVGNALFVSYYSIFRTKMFNSLSFGRSG